MRTFASLVTLFVLGATSCFGGNSEPTATALAPGFKFLWPTTVELPPMCRPEAVKVRVVGAVEAFNSGHTDSFAESFLEAGGQLSPHDVGGRGFHSREAIEEFASERHKAGDGWTLTDLAPPLHEIGLPREAAYGAGLIVQQEAAQFRKPGGAKIVIDCTSGLIRAWIGPPYGPLSK